MSATLNLGQRAQVRAILSRQLGAVRSLVDIIVEIAGCSVEDAEKAFYTFKKAKALKYDSYNGRYSVTHGAFLDREVLIRAINFDHGAKKKKTA